MSTYQQPLTPIDFLERSAAIYREKTAVVDGTRRLTYPELRERVHRTAHFLRSHGIEGGLRVAVLAPNVLDLLVAHFAVPLAGGVLVALNTRLAPVELAEIVVHSGAQLLLVDPDLASRLEPMRGADPAMERVTVRVFDGEFEEELQRLPARFEREPLDEMATIAINYTSGTTGRPKGVMYSHRGAYLGALSQAFHANLRPESVYLWTLPMFHCNGWQYPWAVTAASATHVCLRKVEPAAIVHAIENEGVTYFCAAPTVLVALANEPGVKPFPRTVGITTGGAPPSPATIRQIEALGGTVSHQYGLTESYGPATVCAWQPAWDALDAGARARMLSRQGVPMITLSDRDVRVVDAGMGDVPPDGRTQGEVVIRGNTTMKGYFRDEEATQKAFEGGWFHSGDLAVVHPDGYLEIVDRAKDVVISGGENISTQRVEKALMDHPAVLECAVVGAPDERWGEIPKAFITFKPGLEASPEELIAFCRERLAGFEIPRVYAFEALPKTSTGKVQKFVLRDREWAGRGKRVN